VCHLSVCTNNGFFIFGLKPKIEKKLFQPQDGSVGIMNILLDTNIYLLVGGGEKPFRSKDTIILWDQKQKANIVEIDLREPIKNALISTSKRMIVVLRKKICVFNFDGDLIHAKETYNNEMGVCAVNNSNDDKLIVATLGLKKGEVSIWRVYNDSYKIISAHSNNIEAIALNRDGSCVATASEVGTLIKIFSTESGKQLYEFRRGTSSAKIHSICFDTDTSLLACCSANGTVHIFELYRDEKESKNTKSSIAEYISKDYLPTYLGSEWGYKQIPLDVNEQKMICGFDDQNNLHITSMDGKYFRISGKDNAFDKIEKNNLYTNNT
jgi:WD40 repeat protein